MGQKGGDSSIIPDYQARLKSPRRKPGRTNPQQGEEAHQRPLLRSKQILLRSKQTLLRSKQILLRSKRLRQINAEKDLVRWEILSKSPCSARCTSCSARCTKCFGRCGSTESVFGRRAYHLWKAISWAILIRFGQDFFCRIFLGNQALLLFNN